MLPSRSVTVTPDEDCNSDPAAKVLANEAAVLERNAVGGGELQVGQPGFDLIGQRPRAREPLGVQPASRLNPVSAPLHHRGGRIVRVEEPVIMEIVERHQRREAPRQARMTGERRMLRARQREPRASFDKGAGQHDGAGGKQGQFARHEINSGTGAAA